MGGYVEIFFLVLLLQNFFYYSLVRKNDPFSSSKDACTGPSPGDTTTPPPCEEVGVCRCVGTWFNTNVVVVVVVVSPAGFKALTSRLPPAPPRIAFREPC